MHIETWLKDASPSNELRKRFHGDPTQWQVFRLHYFSELERNPDAWAPIVAASKDSPVTLVYGARDTEHNNAVALREFLLKHEREGKKQ